MKILQKKDTQVTEINRKIGRKKMLNAKEMLIGKAKEDPAVEALSEEDQIRWGKLPQWKKQKLLEKLGDSPQRDVEGKLGRNPGGNKADQMADLVHDGPDRLRAGGSGTPEEAAAAFLWEGMKRGNRESLRRKWQTADGEFDAQIEENSVPEEGLEWQDMQPAGLTAAGAGKPWQHAATGKGNRDTQRADWDTGKDWESGTGRIRDREKLRFKRSVSAADIRKRKNKLARLLQRNGSMVQRLQDFRITNNQDISEKADQTFEKVKRSLDKKIAEAGMKVLKAAFQSVLAALGSTLGIFLLPLLLILILVAVLLMSGSGGVGRANVSPECERYRPLVVQYAKKHEIEDFVEIIMCIMMQESGGRVPDVMQCSECPFNTKYPHSPNSISDPEYSIDVGIQNFKSCLESAGCTELADMDGVKLALQSYNFGNGYAEWAKKNYGGYSLENAKLFSNIWAAKYGWSQYGDPEYVPHVLRYYVVSGGFVPDGITNEEAVGQLNMLMETWPSDMDERRGAVIAKGASLIGKVTYDMYGEDTRAGVDNPRTLDCSSFVAWAFQKSGFTDVPYWSTTGTFVSSTNFTPISASELKPGDVGLMNTIAAGGNNHVGIYVGKDANGTSMWLHCTSHASPGCSTVTDGPRISYYSAFVIFYRYTGFQ